MKTSPATVWNGWQVWLSIWLQTRGPAALKALFCIAQLPLGLSRLDTTRSTCQAHAFWLGRACRTARLDTLVTSNMSCHVEAWETKWNLGYVRHCRETVLNCCMWMSRLLWTRCRRTWTTAVEAPVDWKAKRRSSNSCRCRRSSNSSQRLRHLSCSSVHPHLRWLLQMRPARRYCSNSVQFRSRDLQRAISYGRHQDPIGSCPLSLS